MGKRSSLTRLHALGQRADMGDLLGVDDLVAVDEGQVRLWRHKCLPTESLEVFGAFLRHHVLNERHGSCDQTARHSDNKPDQRGSDT